MYVNNAHHLDPEKSLFTFITSNEHSHFLFHFASHWYTTWAPWSIAPMISPPPLVYRGEEMPVALKIIFQ